MGDVKEAMLTVIVQDNMLSATLLDEDSGLIPVTAISFANDILSYEYQYRLLLKSNRVRRNRKSKQNLVIIKVVRTS